MYGIKAFLFDDDRGVSPVIGVILMVAITVILAAVIASFVLGLGDTNESAPNANFDFDYNASSDNLTVSHAGGDSIDPARIEFQVDGSDAVDQANEFPAGANEDASTADDEIVANSMDDTNRIQAGDSIELDLTGNATNTTVGSGGDDTGDFELDIIFTSEDGGTSSEIGGTTGPDA